jgi:hypothetical protein
MPTNVVKTPEDERLWQKAKARAEEQGEAKNYAYIMGIYKSMNPKASASKVAVRYLTARMSSKIRRAIAKWYKKERYTSGLYPGSYKHKWNKENHPDILEKRFNKMYRDFGEDQREHFATKVLDYYEHPSWARGYEILAQAWEDTDRYFNEPVEDPDPYDDEDY